MLSFVADVFAALVVRKWPLCTNQIALTTLISIKIKKYKNDAQPSTL